MLHGHNSKLESPVRQASASRYAHKLNQQAHPVVSAIIDSVTLKSSLGIVGSHRVWILYERLHSREIQSE